MRGDGGPRALVLTNMWPTAGDPARGTFVSRQVEDVRLAAPEWTLELMQIDGRRGRLEYGRAVTRLRRRLRSGAYDLVHAHYGLTGAVAATQRDAPVVVTLHGSDLNIRWQRRISRFGVSRAAARIYVSARLRRLDGGDGEVIPCGVDLDAFRPASRHAARDRIGVDPDGVVVLFPGDPARPVKDHALFRATLGVLPPRWRERVRPATLGGVRPEDVPHHLCAADAVLLTSRYEGAGSVAKEAVACGVPIASVDVGDVAHAVAGVPGCAVAGRDPGSLARALVRALELGAEPEPEGGQPSAARQRVAGVGRQRLIDLRMDAGSVAARVLSVYRRVAGEAT